MPVSRPARPATPVQAGRAIPVKPAWAARAPVTGAAAASATAAAAISAAAAAIPEAAGEGPRRMGARSARSHPCVSRGRSTAYQPGHAAAAAGLGGGVGTDPKLLEATAQ